MNRDDEIFAEALDLPATERAAFLDRACAADAALRLRVEALLSGHAAAASFLEASPVGRPPAAAEEQPGDVIGRYTLVKKLGEGGCGVVFLAEQTEPVRRRVALKVIKLGMDTRQVITRFAAERQALALMDHADIARVYDAGATAAGRPFFVMEYVDGVPITKFCDEHNLPMAARLELFTRVCLAVQHAHQKGVIHRDLKPSNILVTLTDGGPAPKVIDFGIAKATQGRLTDQTLVTAVEQFIGTPAYMSPEQAELRGVDIDTRSDIYSLGVLLYELLTGRTPFEAQELLQVGLDEMRRHIREVEPPRPSTRLHTLEKAKLLITAGHRHLDPPKLISLVEGDLDWIVMRCLEKDRARRYDTADSLAQDLRRHLNHEPVEARPASAAYRLQKFVARHRLACASVAAVAASLLAGTIISVRQAVRATRAERIAQDERAEARRQREQAENLLTFMLGDFRTELKKLGQLKLLDAVGQQAMDYFAALDPRDLTDTALTRQAKALTQIGETRIEQARYPEAAAAFATAYARAAALAARHPQDGDMLFERAQVEFWTGFIARRRGDFAGAREWLTRYRDSAIALVALEGAKARAQRELTSGHHNLAVLELDRGNLPAAQEAFFAERTALAALLAANPTDAPLRFRLADVASWLGRVAEMDGRFADALAHYREMAARTGELARAEPAVARWQVKLTESRIFQGVVLAITGRRQEAATAFAGADTAFAALIEQDPKNQQWLVAAMQVRLHRAALQLAGGDTAAAAPVLTEARTQLEALVAAEPSARVFPGRLASAWLLEARLRHATARPDAPAAAERAIALGESLVKDSRADAWTLWEFAQAHLLSGRLALAAGQPAAAQAHWRRVIEVLAPRLADSNEWRFLDPAAQAYALSGRPDDARPLIEKLRRFGYVPLDPLAGPTLGPAVQPVTPTQNE